MITLSNLRCEYSVNPLGIGEDAPRLSWIINDPSIGVRQTAWQVQVDSSRETLLKGGSGLWDSGHVESDQSIFVSYGGPCPISRQRCWWRVRVWDQHGDASAWSEPAFWEMGLLTAGDWHATWVNSAIVGGARTTAPAPYLRRSFILDGEMKKARLYVTALGLYECHINGARIGDAAFRPGRTDYHKRLQYDTIDVAAHLRRGENVLGAILGDGWYCGHTGSRDRQNYGDRPALLAQLEITFSDDSVQRIVSDEKWRWSAGPILENDLLMGESYDARLELSGWSAPGYDDRAWRPALPAADPGVPLVAPPNPPVRAVMKIHPVAEPSMLDKGRYLFDLGQNIAGRARLRGLTGRSGHTVRLRFAEMLQRNGELYTENLRSARATDYYTLSGSENSNSVWEPRFTFHGFRYIEVSNLPLDFVPTRETVTGIVLQSDTPVTGEFSCSEPLLNQLQSNIQWSQRGNFLEIPTDCPQRDERQGWTGDAQIFIRNACFNMDVAGFFAKWQDDLADTQRSDGAVPGVAPDTGIVHDSRPEFQFHPGDAGPAWSDAIIICPWTIYRCYGDTRILERHYGELKRYLLYLESISTDLI
ncbi:MAG: family 78 glycoside hydrolase catalytic domain, partial [Lentisphaerae bacterium]|nr:family 78 glycoside hydrolase catalytic domain [Lentisphaerota bacterium]